MNKPKNEPQTYETMLTAAESRKPTKIYREESGQYADAQISRLVALSTEELARICDGIGTVSLADTTAVQTKAVEYLRACSEAATLPGIGGFCRCLGYSLEGMRQFRIRHPEHPTTQFLELFRDLCSDVLTDAALRNLTNSVYSIFIQKARNGLEDKVVLEAVQHDPMGQTTEQSQLAADYADYVVETTSI